MAATSGHHASPGAWLSVILVIIAFCAGTAALITSSLVLWIIAGVAMALGIIGGLASNLMEQAY